MYPTTHGHFGAGITAILIKLLGTFIGLPIGLLLAFLSHFPLDYIGEYPYDDYGKNGWGKLIKIQLPSVIIFFLMVLWLFNSGQYAFVVSYVLGYIAGNWADIRDKAIKYIKKALPEKKMLSCHNGNGFLSIGDWKLGYPAKPITKNQNLAIQALMTVAIVILTLIII